MTNQYEVAGVGELGKAQAVVLGEKHPAEAMDSLTGEFGSLYIEATDDND